MKDYEYIYGPVPSWRLGNSLGIDPLSGKVKICTFDCVYCQLGKTKIFTKKRKTFVPTAKIIEEIDSLPSLKIDYITFSGIGEPTLAKNLGQMIKAVKKIRDEKIAVLTNSSLMDRRDVRRDLLLADFVVAKLDACSQDTFAKVNRPMRTMKFNAILKAIRRFKGEYKGRLALQIMFIRGNKKYAREIARIAKEVHPDEVQINTPLRPCGVKPLSKEDLNKIKRCFTDECGRGIKIISVYDSKKKKVKPISKGETLRRRGKI